MHGTTFNDPLDQRLLLGSREGTDARYPSVSGELLLQDHGTLRPLIRYLAIGESAPRTWTVFCLS